MRSIDERLRELQRIARIGSWEWQIHAGTLEWSEETYRIFGQNPEVFQATYDAFLHCVHPDDRDHVKSAMDPAIRDDRVYSIEHRIVTPEGELRMVRERAELSRDASGTPQRMVGTVQDITDQIHARRKMEALVNQSVGALARAAEVFDAHTGDHTQRIGDYCARLAELVGAREEYVAVLRQQAQLHDVGKIHIPYEILNKQGPLTPEEFDLIQEHTVYGSIIIGNNPDLTVAWQVALHHHEKWDGTGYPDRLRGNEIPFAARLAAIADVFDALITRRSYKKAFSYSEAYEILSKGDERLGPWNHFDPELLKTFLDHYRDFTTIHQNSLLCECERRNRRLVVFLVEDEPPMQDLFRKCIPPDSTEELHVFADVGDIMDFMSTGHVIPHICFVDVHLPGGSGHDVAREIRSAYPGTYLVCSTGGGSVRERGLYDRIFHKPYRVEKIRQMIDLIKLHRMEVSREADLQFKVPG